MNQKNAPYTSSSWLHERVSKKKLLFFHSILIVQAQKLFFFTLSWCDPCFQFPWIHVCDPTTSFLPCALRRIPICQWKHRGKEHRQYGIHNCCYFPQDLESHIRNNPPGTYLDNRPIHTAGNSNLTVTALLLTGFKRENDKERGIVRWLYSPYHLPLSATLKRKKK